MQVGKRPLLSRREIIAAEPIDHRAQLFIGMIVVPWIITLGPQRLDLIHRQTEDKNIISANLLPDLHVGTVEGSDRERTIHGQLHIAGT